MPAICLACRTNQSLREEADARASVDMEDIVYFAHKDGYLFCGVATGPFGVQTVVDSSSTS